MRGSDVAVSRGGLSGLGRRRAGDREPRRGRWKALEEPSVEGYDWLARDGIATRATLGLCRGRLGGGS